MVYSDPNTTLTIYRVFRDGAKAEELWKLKSSLPSDVQTTKYKSWLPARVPIPSGGDGRQSIVIEGSSDIGGIAIDDIQLRKNSCPVYPDEAAVTSSSTTL